MKLNAPTIIIAIIALILINALTITIATANHETIRHDCEMNKEGCCYDGDNNGVCDRDEEVKWYRKFIP